jgi:hypothetical protein
MKIVTKQREQPSKPPACPLCGNEDYHPGLDKVGTPKQAGHGTYSTSSNSDQFKVSIVADQ